MSNKIISGYTTRDHLLVDLDHTSLYKVFRLALMLIKHYPEIGDVLIVLSSTQDFKPYTRMRREGIPRRYEPKESYHLVTNNVIGYRRCQEIIYDLIGLDIIDHAFIRVRCLRGDMTLRVSPVVNKDSVTMQPAPIIYIFNRFTGVCDYKIREYLDLWRSVGGHFATYDNTKAQTYYQCYPTYYSTTDDAVKSLMQGV